jgi:hypothetical protein
MSKYLVGKHRQSVFLRLEGQEKSVIRYLKVKWGYKEDNNCNSNSPKRGSSNKDKGQN